MMNKAAVIAPADKMFTVLMGTHELKNVFIPASGKLANYSSTKKVFARVFKTLQQGYRCMYCKCDLSLQRSNRQPTNYATFEHVTDVFSGGGKKNDDITAIQIACYECNSSRGANENARAYRYYGAMFVNKYTLMKFIRHPKVGWAGIIREFGPVPADFV